MDGSASLFRHSDGIRAPCLLGSHSIKQPQQAPGPLTMGTATPHTPEREPPMPDAVKVQVQRNGRRFDAQAVLDLAADASTVWATITDYAALPRFMPGIRACRVIERRGLPPAQQGGEQLVVQQEGEFRFLLFAQNMKVTLTIEHQPLRVAHAKATAFDLGLLKGSAIEIFEGRYEIAPAGSPRRSGRVQLHYSAVIGLHLPPPPVIGSVAVRQNLEAQLRAVAAEVARRQLNQARPVKK